MNFRSSILLLLGLVCSLAADCQPQIVADDDKMGVQENGKWIIKPKFEVIKEAGEGLFLVKKKERWGYYRLNGDLVIKPSYSEAEAFEHGNALVKDKKGLWQAIGPDGSLIVNPAGAKPKRLGSFLYRQSRYEKLLYTADGGVKMSGFADILQYDTGLWAAIWIKEETYRPHGLLSKKRTRIDTTFAVFGTYNEEVYEPVGRPISYHGAWLVGAGLYSLMGPDGREWINLLRARSFEKIGFALVNDKGGCFIGLDGKVIVPQGQYWYFKATDKYLFAQGEHEAHILDHQGQLQREGLHYIKPYGEDYHVVESVEGQQIVNEDLEALSLSYPSLEWIKRGDDSTAIGRDGHAYQYLHPETFKPLGGWHPIVYGTYHTRGRASIFNALFLSPPPSTAHFGPLTQPQPYMDGLAAVPLLPAKLTNWGHDDSVIVANEYAIRYNFIRADGSYLNQKRYDRVWPFRHGQAFVADGKKYYPIDQNGDRVGKRSYTKIVWLDDHYFVEYRGKWGVLKPDLTELWPCKFDITHIRSGVHYGRLDGEDTVLF